MWKNALFVVIVKLIFHENCILKSSKNYGVLDFSIKSTTFIDQKTPSPNVETLDTNTVYS